MCTAYALGGVGEDSGCGHYTKQSPFYRFAITIIISTLQSDKHFCERYSDDDNRLYENLVYHKIIHSKNIL